MPTVPMATRRFKGGRTGHAVNAPMGIGRVKSHSACAAKTKKSPVPIATRISQGGRTGHAVNAPKGIGRVKPHSACTAKTKKPILKQNGIMNPPKEISLISEYDVLSYGLSMIGFGLERQNVRHQLNEERFQSAFCVPSSSIAPILNDLGNEYPDMKYKDTMMVMNWFKGYGTEHELAGRWGYCEDYIRASCKETTKKIQSLFPNKIQFKGFDENEELLYSVDGKHFQTQEFRLDPSSKWFDHKCNHSGLAYEFALSLRRPAIVHKSGPFPASVNDLTIFRGGNAEEPKENWDPNSLYWKTPPGKKGIGDSGYQGEPTKMVCTRESHSKEFKKFLARAKSRQESLYTRMTYFKILVEAFRHGAGTKDKMERHNAVVEAICVMIQYDFEHGRPPFEL